MNRLVSIIVPCYNAEKFIAETLDSVLNQTYENWECVIVDDGSTDRSSEIMRQYQNKDSRFKCIFGENKGVATARNTAIAASSGCYILPLDADDLIAPKYIEDAVKVLDERPDVKLVYCNAEKFGRKKEKWKLPDYDFNLLLSENMIFCSALYRRADFDQTSGYNPNMNMGYEDWDFWLCLLQENDVVVKLEPTYFFYRTHKKSRNRTVAKNLENMYKQLYLNHKNLYVDYIDNPIFVLKEYEKLKKKRINWF